jgi:arginase
MPKHIINTIGYASGIAANNPGCRMGPLHMQESSLLGQSGLDLQWQAILHPQQSESGLKALPAIADISTQLANQTAQLTRDTHKFLLIGGDHSSAIGSWSGVHHVLKSQGDLGLIWIDAHMDSHTPQTTQSGNIHGMPLAALLGYGAPELCHILDQETKLLPKNVCLIGVRSYESGEAELLKKLGIRIFYMDEIKQKGMAAVMQAAISIVSQNTAGFGLSIDLDAIDPRDAPGVGAPEADGIRAKEFCQSLMQLREDPRLIGVEIVEFNPTLDQQQKTEQLICDSIKAIWG